MAEWVNFVQKDFERVDAKDPVSIVLPLLKTEKQVLVFNGRRFTGVATRKMVLRSGINLPEEKIAAFVYKPPFVTLKQDDLALAKYFIESGLHYLPVFDDRDRNTVLGIIPRLDFIVKVVCKPLAKSRVEDIVSTNIMSVVPSDNLAKVMSMFQEYGFSKLIVFDNKIRGVISLSNILTCFLHATQVSQPVLKNILVKDVMKNEVITIDKSGKIADLVKLFYDKQVSSVVVTDASDLYGIVTKTDLLESYVYFVEQEQKTSSIQISAKFPISRESIMQKLSLLDKFVPNSKIFAYFKLGKERFRGLPLVNCRVRLLARKLNLNVSVEGWGVEHATEMAVKRLKRQLGEVSL